jgi:3-(methylthio)propanoyl-CoA dehydrogenase
VDAVARLRKCSDALLAVLASAPDRAMAVSVPFLRLCALTIGGWLLARSADIAARKLEGGATDREFFEAKIATAHFYATQVLPQTVALEQIVIHGGESVAGTDAGLI